MKRIRTCPLNPDQLVSTLPDDIEIEELPAKKVSKNRIRRKEDKEMRRVKVLGIKKEVIFKGYFHRFFEDSDRDLMAVVERDDGKVKVVFAEDVQFITQPDADYVYEG